jgi:glycosyltransferase involved in cell wall biosynthesis
MTTPVVHVSVMTPVYRPVGRYLAELHASLDRQTGVAWEWIVQVDGGRSALRKVPSAVRQDPRVSLDANGRWFGQAVTRNLALERVRSPLLQTVDADDLLLPGALASSAAALISEPDLALVFGRTWEMAPDQSMRPGKNLYRPGRIEPEVFLRDWEQRGGSCSIVVGSAMWRTVCVDAQGGWPATVAGMDVMLLLAVAATHPARCLDYDSYVYRSHPGQIHRSPTRFAMRPHYRELARRMLAGRRALGIGGKDAGEPAAAAPVPGSASTVASETGA